MIIALRGGSIYRVCLAAFKANNVTVVGLTEKVGQFASEFMKHLWTKSAGMADRMQVMSDRES